jgi:hypothetical protein
MSEESMNGNAAMLICVSIPVQTPVTLNSVLLFSHFVQAANEAAATMNNVILFMPIPFALHPDLLPTDVLNRLEC